MASTKVAFTMVASTMVVSNLAVSTKVALTNKVPTNISVFVLQLEQRQIQNGVVGLNGQNVQ